MNESCKPSSGLNTTQLEWLCRSLLQSNFPHFRNSEISAVFYPYIGLTHTIRRKGSKWVLRISDHCRKAPRHVLEAIVWILACKVMRRRPPDRIVEVYTHYRWDPTVLAALHARRQKRGKKQIRSAQGRHHSLSEIHQELNVRYFNDQVVIERIGWGSRRSWGRLGHYDAVHNSITISPVLDSPDVPRMVVAYIVYHEMLHAVFDSGRSGRQERHHPPEYRRAEEAYPDYGAAKEFLRAFCRKRDSSGE